MSRTTDREPGSRSDRSADAPREESVLRRWSRRKGEARYAERAETPQPAPSDNEAAPKEEERVTERVLTDADMPPLESLDENSDYSLFMSPGVSEALRQAALRKLFRAPQLNRLCELEGEYFDAQGFEPLGNIVTHEMRAALEREADKLKARAEEGLREELTEAQPPASNSAPPAPSAPADDGAVAGNRVPDEEHGDGSGERRET